LAAYHAWSEIVAELKSFSLGIWRGKPYHVDVLTSLSKSGADVGYEKNKRPSTGTHASSIEKRRTIEEIPMFLSS
jgi:hypothetical protein